MRTRRRSPIRQTPPKGPIIVIVDDELDIVLPLSESLRVAIPAARIFPAQSASEALDFIRDNHPHLVIMDWRMPGLSGLELADVLRQMRRPPATILMTAHPSKGLAYQALNEHGFSAIFSKPFDPEVMAKTAMTLLPNPESPPPKVA
jgi:CheY-like chemotaxis protein